MKKIEFSAYQKSSIELNFDCKTCDNQVKQLFYLHFGKSPSESYEKVYCSSCEEGYRVRVWKTVLGKGHIELPDFKEDDEIEVNVFEYMNVEDVLPLTLIHTHFKENFEFSLGYIEPLNRVIISNPNLNNHQKNLLHSSIITALEVYLSDCFIFLLNHKEKYAERYVRSQYKKKNPDKEVWLKRIKNTSFHNLNTAKELYEKSFDITFPHFSHLIPLIDKRHDIVHRGGKDVTTSFSEIEETLKVIDEFVQNVDRILTEL